jgi:hypothetical protein
VIGVLSATLAAFVTLTVTLIARTITVQFAGVNDKLDWLNDKVDYKIDGVRNEIDDKFGGLRGDIAELTRKFDNLDRDVQALTTEVFGRRND